MAKGISLIILSLSVYFLSTTSMSRLMLLKSSKANYQPPPLADYSPTVIAVATLGQRDLYDDFISIWLTVELQNPHTKSDIEDLDHFASKILKLKPKVPSSYFLSCYKIGFELGAHRKCFKYLDIAKSVFPEDWKIPFLEGYISLFILSEPKQASDYFKEAEDLPRAPKYVKGIREKLDEKLKFSLEWTDINSENLDEIQMFLQADPFFRKLLEVQQKIKDKPL